MGKGVEDERAHEQQPLLGDVFQYDSPDQGGIVGLLGGAVLGGLHPRRHVQQLQERQQHLLQLQQTRRQDGYDGIRQTKGQAAGAAADDSSGHEQQLPAAEVQQYDSPDSEGIVGLPSGAVIAGLHPRRHAQQLQEQQQHPLQLQRTQWQSGYDGIRQTKGYAAGATACDSFKNVSSECDSGDAVSFERGSSERAGGAAISFENASSQFASGGAVSLEQGSFEAGVVTSSDCARHHAGSREQVSTEKRTATQRRRQNRKKKRWLGGVASTSQ